ncbi:unnamed protein product [Clavelina lepadiformis]|uniref:Uncharacterized protein n=1 Tax=Clavelina lepadiformis TaxID=159417 RepID=A0ABP0G2X0_CLALP
MLARREVEENCERVNVRNHAKTLNRNKTFSSHKKETNEEEVVSRDVLYKVGSIQGTETSYLLSSVLIGWSRAESCAKLSDAISLDGVM